MQTECQLKLVPKTESERMFADLDKPSLHALSYTLRHPDTWPEGFIWNYGFCKQCAMGLAHELWRSIPSVDIDTGASVFARQFAMPYGESKKIFLGSGDWPAAKVETTGHLWWKKTKTDWNGVTPEMVADKIDAYLATAE